MTALTSKFRFVYAGIFLALSPALYAATTAGYSITATSSANYQNTTGKAMPSVTSNSVVITVGEVAEVSLTVAEPSISLKPGETENAPIRLTNSGNITDSFNLSVAGAPSGWTIRLIQDDNSDGTRQITETTVIERAADVLPGTYFRFFAEITAPTAVTSEVANISIIAASAYDAAVTDRASLTASVRISPYITGWLMNGPYANSDKPNRLLVDYLDGEASVSPVEGKTDGGRTWSAYISSTDRVDLNTAFGANENCVGYAFTYIHSTIEQSGEILLGSDDGVQVWLNGATVWSNNTYRGFTLDQDRFPVTLNEGWNKLLVKVSQGGGNWAFSAAICDASGNAMPGLTTALSVPKTDPPIISNIQVTNIGPDKATVTWITDEPTTATVEYTAGAEFAGSIDCGGPATSHTANLTGLAPSTQYSVKIICTDVTGNSTIATTEFATESASLTEPAPLITQWIINGYYQNLDKSTRLSTDYLGGESAVRPSPGESTAGKKWIAPAVDSLGRVEFHPVYGTPENCAGYAHTYIYSPHAQEGLILVGSDDGVKVWINGSVVWINDVYRGCVLDQDKFPIRLAQGWNSVLVKVTNGKSAWRFTVRVCDQDGNSLPGLSVALSVPDNETPVIADIQVTDIGPDTATISWTTDKPTLGTLEYGTGSDFDGEMNNQEPETVHTATLTGLAPSTLYMVTIICTDVAGNSATATTEFTTESLPSTGPAPLITQWIINGYYENLDKSTRLSTDYLGGEFAIRPSPGETSGDRKWIAPEVDSLGRVEFHPVYGTPENCAGYAHTYIYSPYTQDGLMLLGSDDGVKVWINGNVVWINDVYRGCTIDQDKCPIQLAQGWNSVMVKVTNGKSTWRFTVRVCDQDGNSLPGVNYSVNRP